MTKIFLKKYWIILISACCISTGIVLACAGDNGPEYGTSNFTPEVFVDSAYSPFFYSYQFYYGINYDENHITRFNRTNVQEWAAYIGKPAMTSTLDYLLNHAGTTSVDSALARPAADKRTQAFLDYLKLAKRSEAFALTPIERWEPDTAKKNKYFNAVTLNRQLREKLTAAPDVFLQERYWFQLVRSDFFNESPQDVIRTFDSYSQKFPANTLYYRSLAYKAGAYYKLKDYARANYYYSLVYAGCDQLKTVAHYSFHPQEQKDWLETLALCRNKQEKATLWQMLGVIYSDPQRAIKEIYTLDPGSDKLDLLLARGVNRSEQRFGSFQVGLVSGDMGIPPTDSSNMTLRTLVTHIAEAGNTAKPWIWQLAAGYLNMLDGRYDNARSWYTKAGTTTPKETLPQAQLRLLRLLNTLAASRTIDATLEKQIYPEIVWLDSSQSDQSFRNNDAFTWVRKLMAKKYKLLGDKVKAECFFSEPRFYTDDRNVESLKAFFNKPGKTPYENLVCSLSAIKQPDLFEYQAVRLCLNDHIDEAIAAMKQAEPGAAKIILPGNPFNARINDCHDCDHEAPQKIKYSRTDLLQKLKEMENKVNAGQDVYTNAILVGNAQYNITYYGNARAFYECKVIGSDGWYSLDSVFQEPLTRMKTAIKYYTLALHAASGDEQKAKCQYLLAKCQRNEWYNRTAGIRNPWADKKEDQPDFIAWDGFKALKQYSSTKYYSEVLKECGYFNTYIQKAH
ncbi:MAG TPA: hypothetical protein VGN00_28055 [Puia sp.]|jgi:hypothetical protein